MGRQQLDSSLSWCFVGSDNEIIIITYYYLFLQYPGSVTLIHHHGFKILSTTSSCNCTNEE